MSFSLYHSELLSEVAEKLRLDLNEIAGEFKAEPSSYTEIKAKVADAMARTDRSLEKALLSRWVSEIEPVIWRNGNGQIVGIGTAHGPQICLFPYDYLQELYGKLWQSVARTMAWPPA